MRLKTVFATLAVPATFALALTVTLGAFWPALSGPFFFDDMAHLPKLAGTDGQIDTAAEVLRLLLPEHGGSGRSLSYLALLIDDNAWPADPRPFKHTNLLLHLLNGVLLFALVRLLVRLVRPAGATRPGPDWVALIVMALWLAHPIHLSPTMMVIQRMALLGGLFSLLALLAYVHGRRVAATHPARGYLWLTLGFGTALTLGILSKESALMTVCYVIALEATVLRRDHPPRPPRWGLWATVFLVAPLALLGIYILSVLPLMTDAYLNRDFNLSERLLTEGRVLWQYLRVITLPSLSQSGPFADDFVPSRALFDPPTTLLALATTAGLVGLALWGRRRWPLFALAVLWFFLGHILEGTVLPLELYFEHRNYLPMIGPIFALSYAALDLPVGRRRLAALGMGTFFTIETAVTFASSGVWGDHGQIAALWSAEHPASPRAQVMAIQYWAARGDGPRLKAQLDSAIVHRPNYAGYYLYRLVIERCRAPSQISVGGSMADLERVVPYAAFERSSHDLLEWLVTKPQADRCDLSYAETEHLFDIYLANPTYTRTREARANLYLQLAKLHRKHANLDGTIRALDQAFSAYPLFEIALDQAYYLADAGLLDEADAYVRLAAEAKQTSFYARLRQDEAVKTFAEGLANTRREAGAVRGSAAPGQGQP